MSARTDGSGAGLAALLVVGEPECLALAGSLFPDVAPSVLPAADFSPPAPFRGPLFAFMEAVARTAVAAPGAGGGASLRPQPVLGLVVPIVWYGSPPMPAAVLVADHVNLAGRGPLTGRWPVGRARAFPSMTGVYRPELIAACVAAEGAAGGTQAVAGAPDEDRAAGPAPAAAGRPTGGPGEATARLDGDAAAGRPGYPRGAQHQPPGGRPYARGPIYSALAVAGVAEAARLTPFEARQMRRCGLVAAAGQLVAPVVIAAYHGLAVAAAGAPRAPRGREGTL